MKGKEKEHSKRRRESKKNNNINDLSERGKRKQRAEWRKSQASCMSQASCRSQASYHNLLQTDSICSTSFTSHAFSDITNSQKAHRKVRYNEIYLDTDEDETLNSTVDSKLLSVDKLGTSSL